MQIILDMYTNGIAVHACHPNTGGGEVKTGVYLSFTGWLVERYRFNEIYLVSK